MNEQDIPIEIATSKLLEWLESRKIVQKNWQHAIRDIRSKITSALNDMPVHQELVKLLSGSYITYFHCLQIIEILKTTEADTKSVFGRYGSQRMTDWQTIVRAYEKDSIYLAEAAQILQRHNVEVPGLRRHRNKIGQLIDEAQQRIKDARKTEDALCAEKNALCQQLGIKGANLRDELTERIRELPRLYEEVANDIPALAKAIEYYVQFSGKPEYLPILRHISVYGNTTVYQFVHNEAPLSVVEPPISVTLTVDNTVGGNDAVGEIDFGEMTVGDSNTIDFEVIDSTVVGQDTGDIDWGEIEIVADTEEVAFDISLETSGIEVAASGMDGGVARGPEAYSLMDSHTYRDKFFDELYELEAFLQMRQHEFRSEQANSFVFFLIDGNNQHDNDEVTAMLTQVQQVLALAERVIVEHLHRLKHSPKYADILAGKLHQQAIGVEKSKALREILKEKISTLTAEKVSLKPEILKLIDSTKQLQTKIEADISKRYKGRKVTLYGGVDVEPMDK